MGVNEIRTMLYTKKRAAFRHIGRLAATPMIAVAFFAATLVLFGVSFSGLVNHYEEESSITALYTQKGTRLESEMAFHSDTWGVGMQNFVIMQSDHVHGVASVGSLEAAKDTLQALVRFNESEKCETYDDTANGDAIEAACALQPPELRQNMLYCKQTCRSESGYAQQSVGFTHERSGKFITERHLCDDVANVDDAAVFKPSTRVSMPISDPEFDAAGGIYAGKIGISLMVNPHPDTDTAALAVWNDNKVAWAGTALASIQSTMAAATIASPVTIMDASAAAGAALAGTAGGAYGVAMTAAGTPELIANRTTEAVTALGGAIVEAAIVANANWLPGSLLPNDGDGEGNLVGWGYQEVAACAARNLEPEYAETPIKMGAYLERGSGTGVFQATPAGITEYTDATAGIAAAEEAASASLVATIPTYCTGRPCGLGLPNATNSYWTEATVLSAVQTVMTPAPSQATWFQDHGCPGATAPPTPAAPAAETPAAIVDAGVAGVIAYLREGSHIPATNIHESATAAFGTTPITDPQIGGGLAGLVGVTLNGGSDGDGGIAFIEGIGIDAVDGNERAALTNGVGAALAAAGAGNIAGAAVGYYGALFAAAPVVDVTNPAGPSVQAQISTGSMAAGNTTAMADVQINAGLAAVLTGVGQTQSLLGVVMSAATDPAAYLGAFPDFAHIFAGASYSEYMTNNQLQADLTSSMAGFSSCAAIPDPAAAEVCTGGLFASFSSGPSAAHVQLFAASVAMAPKVVSVFAHSQTATTPVAKFGKYLEPVAAVFVDPTNTVALTAFATNFATALVGEMVAGNLYNTLRGMFILPTVNFAARPLPRKWGIDRFPCTNPSLLEIFREGDFAYPYNLKQLSEVSLAVYGYLSAHSALGLPDCVVESLVVPAKQAVYAGLITTSYTAANLPALLQAECTFAETLHAGLQRPTVADSISASPTDPAYTGNTTAAAQATIAAYLAAGGSPAAVADPAEFVEAVAGSLNLAQQAMDQMATLGQALAAFGYGYRPTYGTHRTNLILNSTDPRVVPFARLKYSTPSLRDVDPIDAIGDAIKAYHFDTDNVTAGGQPLDVTNCLLYKAFPDGSPLRGCLLTWAASFLQPGLVAAGLVVADPGATAENLGENGLSSVQYHRGVMNAYAETNLASRAYLDKYLNLTLTADEIYDELHFVKQVKQNDFLENKWARKPGSGFAPGDAHASETLSFAVDKASSDVVRDATAVEWGNLILCYVAMILLIGLSMTSFRGNVESHFWLGVVGVLVIALAVLSALGVSFWWFGIMFTPVASNVAPFIALGIGVDDMLVMAKGFSLAAKKDASGDFPDTRAVLIETLEEVGPSITFTTLTNLAAFLIATTTPINVVRWFAELMCISVVMNWIFLMFMFVPIMAADYARTKGEFPEFCCPTAPKMGDFGISGIMQNYYGPFLMRDPVRVAVPIIFSVFFGVQLYQGLANTEIGIRNSDIMMSGTHQHDLYAIMEDNFLLYPVDMTTSSVNLDKPEVQADLMMTAKNLAASKWIEAVATGAASIWVEDVVAMVPPSRRVIVNRTLTGVPAGCDGSAAFPTRVSYETASEEDFYPAFASYLGGTGALSAGAFTCKSTNTSLVVPCFDVITAYATGGAQDVIIIGVKSAFYFKDQKDSQSITDSLVDARERVDECNTVPDQHWTFAHGYTYKFWEQYIHSWDDLVSVVGYAILAVVIVTFLFQFSLRSSLLIASVVLMVVIELLGYIPEHGSLKLNAFSIVNLAIAVGMAIEFTAHIVHEFLATEGANKKDRVIKALTFMGEPVILGSVSSMISCAFLAASDTQFIVQYYFAMYFMLIVIATINGLVLLPVMLSFVGDSPLITPGSKPHLGAGAPPPAKKGSAGSGFGFPTTTTNDDYLTVGGGPTVTNKATAF